MNMPTGGEGASFLDKRGGFAIMKTGNYRQKTLFAACCGREGISSLFCLVHRSKSENFNAVIESVKT